MKTLHVTQHSLPQVQKISRGMTISTKRWKECLDTSQITVEHLSSAECQVIQIVHYSELPGTALLCTE